VEGLMNLDEEIGRVQKELDKVRKEVEGVEKKVGNEGFMKKGRERVVEEEGGKEGDYVGKGEGVEKGIEEVKG
uniref:hypothetical protein n=1 Tax=Bacillus altitudinis TaxID=293387 RepID=UPI0011A0AF5F